MCPILGPLVPLFCISGDVSSGFQSQSGFCLIHLFCRGECNVHSLRSTSSATHVDLLMATIAACYFPLSISRGGSWLGIKRAITRTEDERATIVAATRLRDFVVLNTQMLVTVYTMCYAMSVRFSEIKPENIVKKTRSQGLMAHLIYLNSYEINLSDLSHSQICQRVRSVICEAVWEAVRVRSVRPIGLSHTPGDAVILGAV